MSICVSFGEFICTMYVQILTEGRREQRLPWIKSNKELRVTLGAGKAAEVLWKSPNRTFFKFYFKSSCQRRSMLGHSSTSYFCLFACLLRDNIKLGHFFLRFSPSKPSPYNPP